MQSFDGFLWHLAENELKYGENTAESSRRKIQFEPRDTYHTEKNLCVINPTFSTGFYLSLWSQKRLDTLRNIKNDRIMCISQEYRHPFLFSCLLVALHVTWIQTAMSSFIASFK